MPDLYMVRARWFPAVIAGAPAIAFASIFVSWGGLGLPHLIATTALGVLLVVFADVARRRGRAIEPALISKMGGLPSTTMLRHLDDTYDDADKSRIHAFMSSKLNEGSPSRKLEEDDPGAADSFYARGCTWLRENTRDTKKFSVLFAENVTYGFRRNLLGLKVPGFILNAVIALSCAEIFWLRFPVDFSNAFNDKVLAVIVIAVLHAAYLATFVNEQGVFDAAQLYARQLHACCESSWLNKNPKAKAKAKARTKKNA